MEAATRRSPEPERAQEWVRAAAAIAAAASLEPDRITLNDNTFSFSPGPPGGGVQATLAHVAQRPYQTTS